MRVSIVIVTYNSAQYLPRLFETIRAQTVFDQIEVIVLDNGSADQSVKLCGELTASWSKPVVVELLHKNTGYGFAANVGAERAGGEFVFLPNADTWMDPDCVEQLIRAMDAAKADAGVPTIAEMGSSKIVPSAPTAFDIFGRATWGELDHIPKSPSELSHPCFFIAGCGMIIRRDVFKKLGGFDASHFVYAEDDDLSWKLWLAGYQGIYVNKAVLHHRSALEEGTWEVKAFARYLINRNTLRVLMKDAQHVLLLCVPLQILMLLVEACLFLAVSRSWKFVWGSYFKAIIDAFAQWRHVIEMRRFVRTIRRRSDWEMARLFLRFRINRWDMVKAFLSGRRPEFK